MKRYLYEYINEVSDKLNNKKDVKELKEEKIVIIAGFQGVTRDNNITTLGRRRL